MVSIAQIKELGWTPYYKDGSMVRFVKGNNLVLLTFYYQGMVEVEVYDVRFKKVYSGRPESITELEKILDEILSLGNHIIKF